MIIGFVADALRARCKSRRMVYRVSPWVEAVETNGGMLAEMEREYIIRVLRETGGVVSTTAIRLGMPRTTLNAMMKKLGISHNDL